MSINLQKENELLKEKISKLEKKLEYVWIWLQKEVKSQSLKISQNKAKKLTNSVKNDFLRENIEEMIANRINNYFWDLMLLNAPKWTIEWITTAEVNYYNMAKNLNIDGFSVISGYHKVLDLFVENFITNNFRKFAKKKWQTILRTNDPLEKSLHLIVNKKYIMSTWRIYALIKNIREDENLYDYWLCFKDYLNKYSDLREVLLDDSFYDLFTQLNKSEVLSSKRHSWSISKEETIEARKILIWDFKDQNSLIYKLLLSQSVMY